MKIFRIYDRAISAWCAYVAAKRCRKDERLLDRMEPDHARFKGRYIVARGGNRKSSHIHKQFVGFKTELLRR